MGGDCSQKLLLRRGWHSSPGRSRSSDQYEIHNSIAKIGFPRSRFPGVLFLGRFRKSSCSAGGSALPSPGASLFPTARLLCRSRLSLAPPPRWRPDNRGACRDSMAPPVFP